MLSMGVTYRCMGNSYSLGTDKERPFFLTQIKSKHYEKTFYFSGYYDGRNDDGFL